MQSRYYNPEWGRFINADAYASTGQGFAGNNMFAYCNNNPIILADASGTVSRVCITANGFIDEEPWRDHSPSGGGIVLRDYRSGSNYYGEVADKFYTVKFFRAVGNGVKTASNFLWDAYLHSIEKEAQKQYEQDMAIKGGMADELEGWMADPARGGDFAANSTSAITGYITYAALASGTAIPVVGQWIMVGVGAVCATWSILRYYKII